MRFSKSGAFVGGVVATLVIGGGTAVAAGGGSLLLGNGNVTKATTGLTNTKGTPLSLAAKKGTPPLKVNNTVKVKNLDSDLLDGKDSTAFLSKAGTAANSSLLNGQPAAAFLGAGATAADANKLAGQPASAYLGAGATAADSNKLAGQPASAYLNTVYVASTNAEAIPPVAPLLSSSPVFDQISLPAGNYLITFIGDILNSEAQAGNFYCRLEWMSGSGPVQRGLYGDASLAASAFDATTVSQVVTLAAAGIVQVACGVGSGDLGGSASVFNSSLTALPIQSLHVASSSVRSAVSGEIPQSPKR